MICHVTYKEVKGILRSLQLQRRIFQGVNIVCSRKTRSKSPLMILSVANINTKGRGVVFLELKRSHGKIFVKELPWFYWYWLTRFLIFFLAIVFHSRSVLNKRNNKYNWKKRVQYIDWILLKYRCFTRKKTRLKNVLY